MAYVVGGTSPRNREGKEGKEVHNAAREEAKKKKRHQCDETVALLRECAAGEEKDELTGTWLLELGVGLLVQGGRRSYEAASSSSSSSSESSESSSTGNLAGFFFLAFLAFLATGGLTVTSASSLAFSSAVLLPQMLRT